MTKVLTYSKRLIAVAPADAPDGIAVSFVQSSTRSIVMLCLKALPSFQRAMVDRVRTSLALDCTPIHTYLPKAAIEAVIGQLLSAVSPAQFVSDVMNDVQATAGADASSQKRTEAVKSLLALAVVCASSS